MTLIPTITEINAASGSMADIYSAMLTHFNGTDPNWGIVADNGTASFAISPLDTNVVDHTVNFRLDGTGILQAVLDPSASSNIVSTGNATTAPSYTNSSATSPELAVMDFAGTARSPNFYVLSWNDAAMIWTLNAAETQLDLALYFGRTWNSVPWEPYVPSLGLHGGQLKYSTTTGLAGWFTASTTSQSAIYWNTGKWVQPKGSNASVSVASDENLPVACMIDGMDISGSIDRDFIGFVRHLFFRGGTTAAANIGDEDSGGTGNLSFVFAESLTATTRLLVPTDGTTTFRFA